MCEANEITTTKKNNYTNVDPTSEWKIRQDATFFHYCDNETVHGFEWNNFPQHVIPKGQFVCCDMISNFASRPVDWSKFDVVYLGAQKNVGPSGLTIVIARHSVIDRKPRSDIICTSNWGLFRGAPN
jgi:phosphoserine aminotransferase